MMRPLPGRWQLPGTGASATSTRRPTTVSACRSAASAPRYGTSHAHEYVVSTKVGRLLRPQSGPDRFGPGGGRLRGPRRPDRGSETIRATGCSGASSPASSGSDSIASTSSTSTIQKTTWTPPISEAIPALVELRNQGVVGAVGAGMNFVEPLRRFVAETDVDVRHGCRSLDARGSVGGATSGRLRARRTSRSSPRRRSTRACSRARDPADDARSITTRLRRMCWRPREHALARASFTAPSCRPPPFSFRSAIVRS